MADQNYLTIAREGSDEFVERKSRFMGFIKPVTTEEEALSFIREKQKKYWDATHNVYAYVLEGGNLCRFSTTASLRAPRASPCWTCCVSKGSPTAWWW